MASSSFHWSIKYAASAGVGILSAFAATVVPSLWQICLVGLAVVLLGYAGIGAGWHLWRQRKKPSVIALDRPSEIVAMISGFRPFVLDRLNYTHRIMKESEPDALNRWRSKLNHERLLFDKAIPFEPQGLTAKQITALTRCRTLYLELEQFIDHMVSHPEMFAETPMFAATRYEHRLARFLSAMDAAAKELTGEAPAPQSPQGTAEDRQP